MLEDLLESQRSILVSTTIVMSGLAITKPAGLKCRTPAKIAGVRGWIQRLARVTPGRAGRSRTDRRRATGEEIARAASRVIRIGDGPGRRTGRTGGAVVRFGERCFLGFGEMVTGEATVAAEVTTVATLAALAPLATALADAAGADPFLALRAVADPIAAVACRATAAILALAATAVAVATGALVIPLFGITSLVDGPLVVASLRDGLALADVAVDVVSLMGVRTVEVGQEQPVDD